MRCKRCGELLDPADTRCPVCGKTVNPPRRKVPAQKPGETNIKLPQLDKFTHAYGRDAARSRTLQLATIGAVLAAIVLLVMVFVGVGELKDAMSDLKRTADAQLQAIQNQPPVSQEQSTESQTDPLEDTTEDSTEDTTQEETVLPLRQQHVNASLTLYATADGAYASAAMTPGNYDDRATAWVSSSRREGGRETHVTWILEESGDRVKVNLEENYGNLDNLVDMTLSWSSRGDIFGDLGSPVCIWEYRVAGSAWESLPTEYLTPIGGGCELKMSADAVKLLLAQYGQMELRCLVTLTHPAGGTVSILVDGILLDAEGLAVSGSLLD